LVDDWINPNKHLIYNQIDTGVVLPPSSATTPGLPSCGGTVPGEFCIP
jgi:hypothetical protein